MAETIDSLKETNNKLVEENKKWKNKDKGLKNFFDIYDIKDEKDLISLVKKGKEHICPIINTEFNIKDSDYIKELKDIKHNLYILKYEHLYIFKVLRYYNKKKLKKVREVTNKVKQNKITYNNLSSELFLLEKAFHEWCKIPKCFHCDCVFDNNNIPFTVKKYELEQLCKKCISNELNTIIKQKTIIKEIKKEHKNSNFMCKLYNKNYIYLNYYKDLYKSSQEENIDLYDPKIIFDAGFDPENTYDQYKLNNLCYRSNKLLELFEDKINFFNVSESELARIGKMEFEAYCNVLYEVVNGYAGCEDIIEALNMNNVEEPPSDIESDDYIPDDCSYFSDDDAMAFGASLLQRQGLTKVIF